MVEKYQKSKNTTFNLILISLELFIMKPVYFLIIHFSF